MVIDQEELFVGSQNWDWRSLEHVRELGVRIRHCDLASALAGILAMDWSLGYVLGSRWEEPSIHSVGTDSIRPSALPQVGPLRLEVASGDTATVRLAASPPQALPPGVPWDEPLLVEMIDGAATTVCAQVLTFDPVGANRYHGALELSLIHI